MAIHHGKSGVVKIDTHVVAAVTKFSVSQSIDTADTTAMGDSWQTHLTGIPKWSGSCDCHYNPADTDGQAALAIGDSVSVGFYTDGAATGKKYLSGTASVTSIPIDADLNGTVKVSFSFEGNGALSIATVA